jgi:hypothetical protein
MKSLLLLCLLASVVGLCSAQDLTVHVLSDSSHPKPVAGVAVQLFPDPFMSGKRKVIEQKSDSHGIAVFHNIDLSSVPWSVSIYNLVYTSIDRVTILANPTLAERLKAERSIDSVLTPLVTSLPAEITIYVRKRSFGESLQYLFMGP